jgi:hypothetical protein
VIKSRRHQISLDILRRALFLIGAVHECRLQAFVQLEIAQAAMLHAAQEYIRRQIGEGRRKLEAGEVCDNELPRSS